METVVTSRELSQFSVLTKTWLSETAFLTDEIRFLKKLVNHHILFLSNEIYLSTLLEMSKELTEIEKEVQAVRESIKQQFHRLHNASEDSHFMADSVKDSHGMLEEQIAPLTNRFRTIKDTVIKFAANILENRQDDNE
jgi:ribosome-binding ATPase YchF (GTP1/OBG family)